MSDPKYKCANCGESVLECQGFCEPKMVGKFPDCYKRLCRVDLGKGVCRWFEQGTCKSKMEQVPEFVGIKGRKK